jgi:hypothetical protein
MAQFTGSRSEVFETAGAECVNLKFKPTFKAPVKVVLPARIKVHVVGATKNGWREIEATNVPFSKCGSARPNVRGYVKDKYLKSSGP